MPRNAHRADAEYAPLNTETRIENTPTKVSFNLLPYSNVRPATAKKQDKAGLPRLANLSETVSKKTQNTRVRVRASKTQQEGSQSEGPQTFHRPTAANRRTTALGEK